jgi:hypothetical protein
MKKRRVIMDKIANLSKTFNTFFNKKADEISLEVGFIKRQRKLKGSSLLKALICGHLSQNNCSIDGLRQFLSEDSIEITKQGLDFRFTETAVKFMERMFGISVELFQQKLPLDCEILHQFKTVKLLDSTYISLPNEMSKEYQGYGSNYPGKDSYTKAAIKIQLVFDYLNQKINRLDIKEGIRSDQGYRDYLNEISANDLLIADLGYFVPAAFKQINERGAYFISRYKADTNIYDAETHEKLELLALLKHRSFLTREVLLGKEAMLKVRVVCKRLTAQQAEYRKRKANNLAKSRGYQSSQKNQQLLDWAIFITNVPESKINNDQILTIYRVRWQIELLFKLYKSHIHIAQLKTTIKSAKLLCEFYAKLCIVFLFHAMINCIELKTGTEISLTKAVIELKRRVRELFLALKNSIFQIKTFLKNLIMTWSKFSLKDTHRKIRISTLNKINMLVAST